MDTVRPEFVPKSSLSYEEMVDLQVQLAAQASFEDDHSWTPADMDTATQVVAGVDQGFDESGETATSAIVVMCDGEVIERVHASEPTDIPYIPGVLAFREGRSILSAFDQLETTPDVVLFDGSGRIHYREAGLATHIGVALDIPTIGVAKSLLCGLPAESLDEPLPAGSQIPIEADEDVKTAHPGALIGYAVQTRQFDGPNRYINPLFVSPGHRISAATAAEVVLAQAREYKLPEPIRHADAFVSDATQQ